MGRPFTAVRHVSCMVLAAALFAAATARAEPVVSIYYAGEHSVIGDGGGETGFDLKHESLTSTGSQGSFGIRWGEGVLERVEVAFHSYTSLTPNQVAGSTGGKGDSLNEFSFLLGGTEQSWFFLEASRLVYQGTAVADGSVPIFLKDGRQIGAGDEFQVGMTIDLLLLGAASRPDIAMSARNISWRIGYGLARAQALGVEYHGRLEHPTSATAAETRTGSGMAALLEFVIPIFRFSDTTRFSLGMKGFAAATRIGGVVKSGYEGHVFHELAPNRFVSAFAGGYVWLITTWESPEFKSVQASHGSTFGLSASLAF